MAPLVPFATVRSPRTMVCTADQLATQAGLGLLQRGGSAADAAVGANAVLAVTAPHLCGMGGDLFALVHAGPGAPAALSAAGRAGSGADAAALRAEGHAELPFRGDVRSVTVPGCIDGWLALHQRFGRLPLPAVLAPAVAYAEEGFPASPLLVASAAAARADALAGDLPAWVHEADRPGRRVRRPGAAAALRAVGDDGRAGFYGGPFGAGLLALGGGWFDAGDLDRPLAEWSEPLQAPAWGLDLWTVPPPSQGYLTLAGAVVAAGLPLPRDPDDPDWVYLLVEAAVAVAHDRPAVLYDGADGAALLRSDRLDARRATVRLDRATRPADVPTRGGDTTYLCVVDEDRMGVSLIQSNAAGFGSLLFEPATGINLHNRGIGFSLAEGHPAELRPGARPPHTLSPALATHPGGGLAAVLGTQGGDAQPQILLQVLARWRHADQGPADAIGRPRFALTGQGRGFDTWTAPGGPTVAVEAHAPAAWAEGLRARGHQVRVVPAFDHGFGHAHLIVATDDGLAGAADPRARVGSCAGT